MSTGDIYANTKALSFDTSVIAILPYDATDSWLFKNGRPAIITNKDLATIETTLIECLKVYNAEEQKWYEKVNVQHPEYKFDKSYFVINLARHKRQYVAFINEEGEKEVWVNCFCDMWGENWRKEIIQVDDGGNCYFNLKINLTTGKYYDLIANGFG